MVVWCKWYNFQFYIQDPWLRLVYEKVMKFNLMRTWLVKCISLGWDCLNLTETVLRHLELKKKKNSVQTNSRVEVRLEYGPDFWFNAGLYQGFNGRKTKRAKHSDVFHTPFLKTPSPFANSLLLSQVLHYYWGLQKVENPFLRKYEWHKSHWLYKIYAQWNWKFSVNGSEVVFVYLHFERNYFCIYIYIYWFYIVGQDEDFQNQTTVRV